jgi:hypothetical protein
MDDTYIEFVNNVIYPQKVDSLKAYPGDGSIKLQWLKGNDPMVIKAKVFWNNYTESMDVDIPAGKDTITCVVNNLDESTYTFHVKTYDAEGNESIPVEITSRIYGPVYESTLSPRSLIGLSTFSDRVELIWNSADKTVTRFYLTYTNWHGESITREVPLDEDKTVIDNYKLGGAFSTVTWYRPEPNTGEFKVGYASAFPIECVLSKVGWTAEADGNHVSGEYVGPSGLIDDNIEACWHSGLSPQPHWFIVDMKENKLVKRFEVLQNPSYIYVQNMKVETSTDKTNWTVVGELEWPFYAKREEAKLGLEFEDMVETRYFRVTTTKGSIHPDFSNIAEIYVYGEQDPR